MRSMMAICGLALWVSANTGWTQTTAFSYQGRLLESGQPFEGPIDLRAVLFDAEIGGAQVGPILTNPAVAVEAGTFITQLDFGPGVFQGDPRWLEIAVRPAALPTFTTLSPRQPLNPTP
jgi:hypothetical protein